MNESAVSILIIDDDESFRQMISTFIEKCLPSAKTTTYDPIRQGLPKPDFNWGKYDVLILDYQLGCAETGLDIIQSNNKKNNFPATVMLTGEGNEKIAVLAMKYGADDYISKNGLTKTQLKDSILDALKIYNEKKEKKEIVLQNTQPFNKSLFYSQLENNLSPDNKNKKSLLIVELDNYKLLEESKGYIVSDNIIMQLAQEVFQVFEGNKFNPIITRFSETSIALLIDNSHDQSELIEHIEKMFLHLANNPYTFNKESTYYTVSVGIVQITNKNTSVESVIKCARYACSSAGEILGNSYHIYASQGAISEKKFSSATGKATEKPVSKTEKTVDKAKAIEDSVIEDKKSKEDKKSTEKKPEINIKEAINENRVLQFYQPIMPLSDTENRENTELFVVCARMLNVDGSLITPEEMEAGLQKKNNQKVLDRWMLRRAVSRLVRAKEYTSIDYMLFIDISKDSLADASFFNWLKKLMNYVKKYAPGKFIILGFTTETFISKRKQAEALMDYLRKAYEFRFFLSASDDVAFVKKCGAKAKFNYIKLPHNLIRDYTGIDINDQTLDGETGINLNEQTLDGEKDYITQSETPLIADQVENSSILTNVISTGADFAMGSFIGEPQEQLEEMIHLESFEIS